MGENIVITIARQYGSGGKTIGAMLAKELGINCYSREILKMASEESGINEGLFGMSDEKIKKAPWFKILNRPYDGELLTPEDRDFVSDDNLFNYQAKVIRDLAEKESCVIVGRCADYALAGNPDCVSVFIHADMDFRLKRIKADTDKEFKDDNKVIDFINKTDKKRANYYNYYSSKKWGDSRSYDFCIDSSVLGIGKTVDMIIEYLKIRYPDENIK